MFSERKICGIVGLGVIIFVVISFFLEKYLVSAGARYLVRYSWEMNDQLLVGCIGVAVCICAYQNRCNIPDLIFTYISLLSIPYLIAFLEFTRAGHMEMTVWVGGAILFITFGWAGKAYNKKLRLIHNK